MVNNKPNEASPPLRNPQLEMMEMETERLRKKPPLQIPRSAEYEKGSRAVRLPEGGRMKKILDVTCGSRSIWFNKNHPAAIYCDKREEECSRIWKSGDGKNERTLTVSPDVVCDFTDLPFADNSFALVVFDPPHLQKVSETAWLYKKYGKLGENWREMLHDGFAECMRVLKPDGVLIFKWSEFDIPAEEVWKALGAKPLFGHHSGKNSKTFWGCFMKLEPATNRDWLNSLSTVELVDWIKNTASAMSDAELLKWMEEKHETD